MTAPVDRSAPSAPSHVRAGLVAVANDDGRRCGAEGQLIMDARGRAHRGKQRAGGDDARGQGHLGAVGERMGGWVAASETYLAVRAIRTELQAVMLCVLELEVPVQRRHRLAVLSQ
ncbi:MAG: hypothetical protein M3065_14615 [Actinomycetota bacterium]|nr:hypothetical protein [Actinomycetota bacterium]